MKKAILIMATVAIFSFTGSAIAQSKANGDPFQAIWNAIDEISRQIANIQLIPGPKGDKGDTGEPGSQGIQGERGPMGEVEPGFMSRPAFDSGWITLPPYGAVIDVPHTVGGDINDYFVYASYRRPNGSQKSHQTAADTIWWEDVEPNNIQIVTNGNVTNNFDAARIRIWKIK